MSNGASVEQVISVNRPGTQRLRLVWEGTRRGLALGLGGPTPTGAGARGASSVGYSDIIKKINLMSRAQR